MFTKPLPGVIKDPLGNGLLVRGVRKREIRFKDQCEVVEVAGYYPEGNGEAVFVGEDLAVVDEAIVRMRERWQAKQQTAPVAGKAGGTNATGKLVQKIGGGDGGEIPANSRIERSGGFQRSGKSGSSSRLKA